MEAFEEIGKSLRRMKGCLMSTGVLTDEEGMCLRVPKGSLLVLL